MHSHSRRGKCVYGEDEDDEDDEDDDGSAGSGVARLLRCVDDSSRGPIMTSKMRTMRTRRMKMRKMMSHHRRRLDSNLQLHFVPLFLHFFFPPPVLHHSTSPSLFTITATCHTLLPLRTTYLPTYMGFLIASHDHFFSSSISLSSPRLFVFCNISFSWLDKAICM